MFVFLWFHGFITTVNMYLFHVPSHEESMAMLFASKIPNADGTLSEDFFINENLLSMFHFLVAYSSTHLR